jgi:hypothetical protein
MNEETASFDQTKFDQTKAHAGSTCFFCEATDAVKKFLDEVGPSEEAKSHFRQSRVELLKGIRRIIDDRIERVSQKGSKGTHVVVE